MLVFFQKESSPVRKLGEQRGTFQCGGGGLAQKAMVRVAVAKQPFRLLL